MRGASSVLDVLRVANFLAVAVVNDAARDYLAAHLAPRNALRIAALAEAHGLSEARDVAVTYAGDHFGELAAAPARSRLSRVDAPTLRALLASDALRVDGELDVFLALMAWLDAREGAAAAAAGAAGGGGAAAAAEESNAPQPAACPPDLLGALSRGGGGRACCSLRVLRVRSLWQRSAHCSRKHSKCCQLTRSRPHPASAHPAAAHPAGQPVRGGGAAPAAAERGGEADAD